MSTSVAPSASKEVEFTPVRSRKKRRKGASRAGLARVSFSVRLQNAASALADSEWIKNCQMKVQGCLETLRWDPPEVLCLGLGSPIGSENAAAQLALVVSICDSINIARDRVSFFDPNFAQEDIDGLLEMRFCVLSENKRGKHALRRRTLLVMPHCGVELYENVLRENWGLDELQHFLLLGNVLQDYAISTSVGKLEREAPCLSRLWKHLACDPISPCGAFPSAFNNLGVQYVRMDLLPPRGDVIWTLPRLVADKTPSEEIV